MLRYFSKASRGALQYLIVCRLQVHKAMNTNSKQILLWIGWQFYLPLWRFYLMTPVRVYGGKCCSYKPSSWYLQKRRYQFFQEQNVLQKPFDRRRIFKMFSMYIFSVLLHLLTLTHPRYPTSSLTTCR